MVPRERPASELSAYCAWAVYVVLAPAAISATPLNGNHLADLSFLKVIVPKPFD